MSSRNTRPILFIRTIGAVAAATVCAALAACNADNATRRATGYSTDSNGEKWVTDRDRDPDGTDPRGVHWRSGPNY